MWRIVGYFAIVLVLLLVLVLWQHGEGTDSVSDSVSDYSARYLDNVPHRSLPVPRLRRVRIADQLPKREFLQPGVVEPVRTDAGTLLPLVAHVWAGAAWDAVADGWARQGWAVERWPTEPSAELVHRYFGTDVRLELARWPYLIVYHRGGLFACDPPRTDRSLKGYLIYTAFEATAVFFLDEHGLVSDRVFAAQAHHPTVQSRLDAAPVPRAAWKHVRMVPYVTFINDAD